jgi:CPA2 family monovalent cation:H+ antiporter-2
MPHHLDLLTTLTGGLVAALSLGYLTHRIGLSPIVGYLLAGVAVGPYTPGFVGNRDMAEQMAELGVILLMFGVGLHFHWRELLAVRRIALPGAIVQSLVATVLGALATLAIGWGWTAGIVYGLAISVASTVVLTRVLADHNDLHTPVGHIAVGWLVVEDLFTVLVLVLLPAIFGKDQPEGASLPWAVAVAFFKISVLVGFTFLVGGRVIPWLLAKVAETRSRELFTLTTLVVALGIAVGSARWFGVSMALGAFLAGMVVGRSELSLRAAAEALPMRDAFAVLFFVSVGMLFNPGQLLESPGLISATLAIVLLGKPLAALAIAVALRYPTRVALGVAVSLAQIGEFSFILAALAKELGVLEAAATNALVATAILSISINPLLYRYADPFEAWAIRRFAWWRGLNARATPDTAHPTHDEDDTRLERHRAVVIGYGPVGRTLVRLLRENDIEPTIIEMNLDTIRQLREEGIQAVYGDASQRDTLESAGVALARTLILSASGFPNGAEVIRLAREMNPDIHVLARATYLREHPALSQAGADQVFSGEGEVALAMTESVLDELGATPEQIDRERERVHEELFPNLPAPAPTTDAEPVKRPAAARDAAPASSGDASPAAPSTSTDEVNV